MMNDPNLLNLTKPTTAENQRGNIEPVNMTNVREEMKIEENK